MNDFQNPRITFAAAGADQMADLSVFTERDWEDGIIVTNIKGGPSVYTLTTDDTIYLSYAIVNYGDAAAGSFAGMCFIDGVPVYSLESSNGLKNRSYTIARNVYIGSLAAGRHIISVKCDYYNSVDESNELNNEYSVIIKVTRGETIPADYLLNTRWAQDGDGKSAYNFNKYVPDGKKTGCTNTALSQILYYWVEQGYGLQLQVLPDDHFYRVTSEGTETIEAINLQDRCGLSLDYLNEIIDTITCDEPNWDDDDDIAGLNLASMLILNSEVGDSSTSTTMFTEAALLDRADFNYDCVSCTKGNAVPWDRIQANLEDDCPVLAGIKSIMHTLVIDGYNSETNEYHLNFGWGFEGYKNDKKYKFDTGTGWYSAAELDNFDIMYLVLDVYPNYDIDDPTKKPLRIVDWSGKLTPEMSVGNGFYVTIATSSQMLSMNILQNGVNVFMHTKNAILTSDCMDGTPVLQKQKLQTSFGKDDAPLLLQGENNGLTDVFFARAVGTWDKFFEAVHVGSTDDWKGTGEIVAIAGKNKFCDIFEGTGNTAILRLTDDACGDALFAEDIFTASYDNLGKKQARVINLHEIFAGAGDDIIDMTSDKFVVMGVNMTIHGNDGNDIIWGSAGQNTLFGDAGDDRLVGGPGNDVLVGGTGDDFMAGEGGDDVFCFCENWGNDVISQEEDGTVTLWFASGNPEFWDADNLTYAAAGNSVCVNGVDADRISLKFGDDGSEQFGKLKAAGAFSNGLLA